MYNKTGNIVARFLSRHQTPRQGNGEGDAEGKR